MFSFEVRERDLLGRIGRLETKSGRVETPLFLPVINPAKQVVPAADMKRLFGCDALITNAYILKKHSEDGPAKNGLHKFLDYDGTVMTDSGAYQILAYGQVESTPEEIIQYQEMIDTDIATILDIPTGWEISKEYADHTVSETLNRAKSLEALKTRQDIAWVGPVQGGRYLDLVSCSAREMAKLPFQIHALGSPTSVMEQYLFSLLLDMVLTAKIQLPPDRPFHLFGAGHPFMFSFAIALGCDLFDSAAYSIYAREDRYMTEYGTLRTSVLRYLPCSCPVCSNNSLKELLDMPKVDREESLTKHNLYVCFSEMKRIKQAISEGRLWEYLEMRAHGHPSLLQALKLLRKYDDYLEKNSPITKRSGIFFFSSVGLSRPEVVRHRKRLFDRYSDPSRRTTLVLLPPSQMEFYRKRREYRNLYEEIGLRVNGEISKIDICLYAAPFGITPVELHDVYPLSQCVAVYPPDDETVDYIKDQVVEYIGMQNYERIVVLYHANTWEEEMTKACDEAMSARGIYCKVIRMERGLNKNLLTNLASAISGID